MRYLSFASFAASVLVLTMQAAAQESSLFSRWSSFCEGVGHTAGVALGDLDDDGDLDLILANGRHLNETDWIYLNDGAGTFYGRRPLAENPDPSYGVALGDLDGDGDLDAVVANDNRAWAPVYRNDGRGNFAHIAGLGAPQPPLARRAVALGDLDGDGDLDAVLVGVGQDHIYVNDGTGGRWTARALGTAGTGPVRRATGVAVADIDRDNDLDIIVPGRYQAASLIHLNDGKGGFAEAHPFGSDEDDMTSVAVNDLDGDADLDIVAVNWQQPHAVYLNDGRGRFSENQKVGTGKERAWSIAIGDLDLDGDLDAVVGNENVDWWSENRDGVPGPDFWGQQKYDAPNRIYLNDGRGQLIAGETFGTNHDSTRPVALGDVDSDGDLDIVAGNDCQPSQVIFNSLRPRR